MLCMALACVANEMHSSLDVVRPIFSSDSLNSTNILYNTESYCRFKTAMRQVSSVSDSLEVETFVVCAITSMVVTVSTNMVDDGMSAPVIEDCSHMIGDLSRVLCHFPTNAELCLMIANYLGRVRVSDFPTPIAAKWGGPVVKVVLTTNKTVIASQRARWTDENRAYDLERGRQLRIRHANNAVMGYRRQLFGMCGLAVAGCRKTMSQEAYTAFTNELIEVSAATEEERKILLGNSDKSEGMTE